MTPLRNLTFASLISAFVLVVCMTILLKSTNAHADQYITGEDARAMLRDTASIHFEAPKGHHTEWCFSHPTSDTVQGKVPLCGSNDKKEKMHISIFVSPAANDLDQYQALRTAALDATFPGGGGYTLKRVDDVCQIVGGITVEHFRVFWNSGNAYHPYGSIATFSLGDKDVIVIFFNGASKKTRGNATPISKEVEAYLHSGNLGMLGDHP